MLDWLEDKSDWLSPIVVKEVRQAVRGREFHYSFLACLIVGLSVAFFGAASATTSGTAGSGTFSSLLVWLSLFGMLVVPIAAFSAMRAERMEQTLELVMVTALSPRHIVVGKLMAQAVKLLTLFAALAPFMTMSFLLGGIDFVTILVSLGVLFLWSLWAAAVFLFISTLFKSRAMSGVVFGIASVLVLFILTVGRGAGAFAFGLGLAPMGTLTGFWWGLAMIMTGCVATTVNFLLLAESRLAVPTSDRVTPLRVGFAIQFLLIVAWSLSFVTGTPPARANAAEALAIIGGLHLALVAVFTVTEDLTVPRRVLIEMRQPSRWGRLRGLLRPGAGRGAVYVLVQMAVLVVAGSFLDASASAIGWRLGICAYICAFTGVPAYLWRRMRPEGAFKLRVVVLVLVALALILPDLIYYIGWQPADLSLAFSSRHLLNPFRVLANWSVVESSGWLVMPAMLGAIGLVAYGGLVHLASRATSGQPETGDVAASD